MIDLPDPIRALGTYHVPVKIAQKLAPEITVNVIDEASSSTEATVASAETANAAE